METSFKQQSGSLKKPVIKKPEEKKPEEKKPVEKVAEIPDYDRVVFPPFDDLTKLLYGEPSTGKTTFASKTKGVLFAATEPGHDFIQSPVVQIRSWGDDNNPKPTANLRSEIDFKTFVVTIESLLAKGKGIKHVVVDIVDHLQGWCLDAACARKGISYPPENDFGKTWKEITDDFKYWIGRLIDAVPTTFITHCTTDKVTLATGKGMKKEIDRRIPTFKGNKAAQFLDGIINLTGYVHIAADGSRAIQFSSAPELTTKDRSNLFGDSGPLPLDYEAVKSFYEQMAKEKGIYLESRRS